MKTLLWLSLSLLLIGGGAIILCFGFFLTEKLMFVGLVMMMLSGATWSKMEESEDEKK